MGYLNEDGLATLVGKVKGQVVQLTSAEYRNLPASKNSDNKTYFVTDEDYAYAIDDEPTVNSDNLVKSGGVYTYTSKIGSGTLTTTAQTIIPAINELDAAIDTINTGLSNLNNRTVPQNLTITPGANITFGTQTKACVIDGFIYVSIKGIANATITNAVVATISGDKNFIYPTTIPIGIGGEWEITDSGYGFLSGKNVTATIPNGKWFHLVATIPYA